MMILLYLAYLLYIILAVSYIFADYNGSIKIKVPIKIGVSLLYLALAVLAYVLNRVATTHFVWILIAMSLCFIGDIAMLGASKHKRAMVLGMGSFLVAHIVLAVYFGIMAFAQVKNPFSWWQLLALIVGIIAAVIFVSNPNMHFGRKSFKIVVAFFFVMSVLMIINAVTLVNLIGPQASLLIVAGVSLTAVSDFFLAYKYFGKTKNTYALGTALVLYYTGMAVLPLSILYI